MKLFIEARREGYAVDQIRRTMTVGDLISMLEQYEEDTPVYLGHDPQSYGFYTYGGITEDCFSEKEELWYIVRNGEILFTGTEEECAMKMEADTTGELEMHSEDEEQ